MQRTTSQRAECTIHTKFRETGAPAGQSAAPTAPAKAKVKEEQFYEAFADWLVKELEECTKAIPVGGTSSR